MFSPHPPRLQPRPSLVNVEAREADHVSDDVRVGDGEGEGRGQSSLFIIPLSPRTKDRCICSGVKSELLSFQLLMKGVK